MTDPDFWNDQQKAQTIINEANGLKDHGKQFQEMNECI